MPNNGITPPKISSLENSSGSSSGNVATIATFVPVFLFDKMAASTAHLQSLASHRSVLGKSTISKVRAILVSIIALQAKVIASVSRQM